LGLNQITHMQTVSLKVVRLKKIGPSTWSPTGTPKPLYLKAGKRGELFAQLMQRFSRPAKVVRTRNGKFCGWQFYKGKQRYGVTFRYIEQVPC